MKRIPIALTFLLAALVTLGAQAADVTYTDGEASVRTGAGKVHDAVIGDSLKTGDSVKTGGDGAVELDQKGLTLRVGPKTVFTLLERERGGQKTGVVSVTLGSLKMKYSKITGLEPLVATASCAAAVRGTELTVYAGADGSSLIAVDSGAVQVEAEGRAVDLDPGEGVEVKPGQPPGEKFKMPATKIDYSKWNEDKVSAMLADPVAALSAMIDQMNFYVKNAEQISAYYEQYRAQLALEKQKSLDILAAKGKDEAARYQRDVVFPLQFKTGNLFLNSRYYTLGALSLRRFVAGRLYLLVKERSIAKPDDPAFKAFAEKYGNLLSVFGQFVEPRLVEADI
jgi:hypothetical protein